MTDLTDVRVVAYRRARAAVETGLGAPLGATERYKLTIAPYLECMAEMTPDEPVTRRAMMGALYHDARLPLGTIAAAFSATTEEFDYLVEHPPVVDQPQSERDRLRALPYAVYLRTPHWLSVRRLALERAEGRCAICNSSGPIEVHHRTYERRGAERPADVVALCSLCHRRHHGQMRSAA